MKIVIEKILNQPTEVATLERIGGGGEGDIYKLPGDKTLGKIYRSDMLTRERQEKVLNICSSFEKFQNADQEFFAFPHTAAVDEKSEVVGFAMKSFSGCPQLDMLNWKQGDFQEAEGKKLDLKQAVALVYKLYESLERLHKAKIIIGDLNPSNILYDFQHGRPVFIDLDSAQIGNFSCAVVGVDNLYLDPVVEAGGVDANDCYRYTNESDYFALAIVACELLTGGNPYMFRSEPSMEAPERRKRGIAIMGFAEDADFGAKHGQTLKDVPLNKNRLERFKALKEMDRTLYTYLCDTLLKGVRESLLRRLPKSDKRHPEHAIRANITTIKQARGNGAIKGERFGGVDLSSVTTELVSDTLKEKMQKILGKNQSARLRQISTSDPIAFKMFLTNFGLDNLLAGSR